MCFGGGGSGGTITMPNTGAYDGMLNAQMAAMRSQFDGQAQQSQAQLDAALRNQTNVLRQLSEARTQRAEEAASVEAEARRLANIVGPPPPEDTAKAPVVGRDRSGYSGGKKGKQRLRIALSSSAPAAGVGTGLNIT